MYVDILRRKISLLKISYCYVFLLPIISISPSYVSIVHEPFSPIQVDTYCFV